MLKEHIQKSSIIYFLSVQKDGACIIELNAKTESKARAEAYRYINENTNALNFADIQFFSDNNGFKRLLKL